MYWKIVLSFIFLIVFISCDSQNQDINQNNNTDLHFSLKLSEEKSLSIKYENQKLDFENENSAFLFVFFTSYCKPCLAQIPHLNNLAKNYQNKAQIIGVLLEELNEVELKDFVKKQKIAFPLAIGTNNYILAKAVGGIDRIPSMILYDKNGKKLNHYQGMIAEEMLDIDIQKAINNV